MVFSKALESIDDIEVELEEWGEGSKWFTLKVRVKSLASKVDLMDVLKQLRQSLESVYHRKPLDELQKLEAEKKKIIAESDQIKKETESKPTSEQTAIKNIIDTQKEILSLQQMEIDLESKKADIRLKNIEALKGLGELMTKGVIENNSQIQIIINNMIFFERSEKGISFGDSALLDVDERRENKNDPES